MEEFTAQKVNEIYRAVHESELFEESKYPYLNSYIELNAAIISAAKSGRNSISFDFVDKAPKDDDTWNLIKTHQNRIYLSIEGGQAEYDVYNYPNYLLARGFNVEVRKAQRSHGYPAKSYYITW